MLTIECQISGGQVGRQIADDEEEFAYMLKELAGYEGSQFQEVPGYLDGDESAAIVTFLRGLADAIEAAS